MALAATVGSLYYSEVANFEPCSLCWYQRIAMYPLLVILLVGALTRDRFVARYALPLTIGGSVLAIYNYLVQLFPGIEVACSRVSCSTIDVEAFGWLTMPLMSLVSFAAITAGVLYDRASYNGAEEAD
ncbi:MAG: disulfide bond formation protein B [Acidimicrobiia bacterium]|nr:disulfide bond formation protein B [Acidimicrobiia bacterium]